MFGCRLMLGIGEAGRLSVVREARLASGSSREQRALATSIFDSGSRVGSALSIPVVALIISSFGWEASFIITGVIGFVWILGWFLIYRNPSRGDLTGAAEAAPQVRAAPKNKVDVGLALQVPHAVGHDARLLLPELRDLLLHHVVSELSRADARLFAEVARHARHDSRARLAIPGGWLGGFVSDSLYRRGWSLTAARKTCMVGGMLLSSVITLWRSRRTST